MLAAGPELQGDKLLGAGAEASADIVAADNEIAAVINPAPHQDMDVGMLSVPMVDRRPIESGPEIARHLAHEVTGEGAKVGKLSGVVGRDDASKMMSVAPAAIGEVSRIHLVAVGIKHSSGRAVAGDAVALQIAKMRGKRRRSRTVSHDARLDHNAARMGGQAAQRRETCRPAAAECATPLSARVRPMQTARLLHGGQHARHEALRSSRLRRAEAAGPNANVVVTRHGKAQTRWK